MISQAFFAVIVFLAVFALALRGVRVAPQKGALWSVVALTAAFLSWWMGANAYDIAAAVTVSAIAIIAVVAVLARAEQREEELRRCRIEDEVNTIIWDATHPPRGM